MQEAEKTTWWQWATSSTKTQKEDEEKLSEAIKLSAEEKGKLFEAIGYTAEDGHSDYPLDVSSSPLVYFS